MGRDRRIPYPVMMREQDGHTTWILWQPRYRPYQSYLFSCRWLISSVQILVIAIIVLVLVTLLYRVATDLPPKPEIDVVSLFGGGDPDVEAANQQAAHQRTVLLELAFGGLTIAFCLIAWVGSGLRSGRQRIAGWVDGRSGRAASLRPDDLPAASLTAADSLISAVQAFQLFGTRAAATDEDRELADQVHLTVWQQLQLVQRKVPEAIPHLLAMSERYRGSVESLRSIRLTEERQRVAPAHHAVAIADRDIHQQVREAAGEPVAAMYAHTPTCPEVPTHLGPYQLLGLIGKGGMGQVWRAVDRRTEATVALKTLLKPHGEGDEHRIRFEREMRIVASLGARHIVPVHDFGEHDGWLFIAMQLVDGEDLRAGLLAGGPLNPCQSVHLVVQVASALDAAHARGIVHRDVKPANILLVGGLQQKGLNFAYLTDFGIARPIDGTRLTALGQGIGTPGYAAPEQWRGEGDQRVDVFALGRVLQACTTGLGQRSIGDLALPLQRVIEKATADEPSQRFGDVIELARAAQAATDGPSAQEGRDTPP